MFEIIQIAFLFSIVIMLIVSSYLVYERLSEKLCTVKQRELLDTFQRSYSQRKS